MDCGRAVSSPRLRYPLRDGESIPLLTPDSSLAECRVPPKPRSPRWGGAVAGWELTRLARRGSPTASRILVGILLFAALVVTYLAAFPQDLDPRDFAETQAALVQFGQEFALILLLVQTALVVVV